MYIMQYYINVPIIPKIGCEFTFNTTPEGNGYLMGKGGLGMYWVSS